MTLYNSPCNVEDVTQSCSPKICFLGFCEKQILKQTDKQTKKQTGEMARKRISFSWKMLTIWKINVFYKDEVKPSCFLSLSHTNYAIEKEHTFFFFFFL